MVTVNTQCGTLRGSQEGGLSVFRGIPYARPPVGPLRFRPPQPPEPWGGVRDALRFGPAAPQDAQAMGSMLDLGIGRTDEDCLYLNVWTPAPDAGGRPVMVWIHGGAFILGAGSQHLYDGATLARRGDVVVVTINYRLGALGFLPLQDAQGQPLASGNEGLLDQIAALQWVQREIAAFGGDPGCVTIFGESAGAMSCAMLLGAPRARGLFQRAILQSGSANYLSSPAAAAGTRAGVLRELGLTPQQAEALMDLHAGRILGAQRRFLIGLLLHPRQVLAGNFLAPRRLGATLLLVAITGWRVLRRLLQWMSGSLHDLARMRRRGRGPSRWRALWAPLFTRAGDAELPFEPVLDGALLPRHPFDAVADGLCAPVALLIGTNLDEQKLFAFMDPQARRLDEKTLLARCTRKLAHAGVRAGELARRALQTYRAARTERGQSTTPSELWFAFENDRTMRWPALRLAELQSAHQAQTYSYLFSWRSPILGGALGACHALELPFVFGTLDHPALRAFAGSHLPGAHELAARMQDAWIQFARTGNPSHPGLGTWPPYEPGRRATMILDRECRVEYAPLEAERAFWEQVR